LLIGDHLLVDRQSTARNPERGDLIVFEFPEDPEGSKRDFMKRVVAIEGDSVEIRDKVLFLNGEKVAEPYVVHMDAKTSSSGSPRDFFGPVTVPESAYFVLGDNRDRSYDSRFWGFVGKDEVKGTVKIIYWSWDSSQGTVRWNRIGMDVL
jgi:signal peptidase I